MIWVFQEADRYRDIFHECVNETAQLLREAHRYKDLYDLGIFAVKADPFSEWEVLVMESLTSLGQFAKAESYYDKVVNEYIDEYGNQTNDYVKEIISNYMKAIDIELIDFSLEFGRFEGKILVADEITPDVARFWDAKTHERLDIDRFRRDIGGAEQAYQELLHRMMGMEE